MDDHNKIIKLLEEQGKKLDEIKKFLSSAQGKKKSTKQTRKKS